MLKTAREVFILTEGGAEVKSYSSAGQAVLLLFLVPAYGAIASRVNRDSAGAAESRSSSPRISCCSWRQ